MRRRWAWHLSGFVIVAALLVSPLASVVGAQKATGTPIPVTFVNLDGTSSTAPARQGARAAVREINRAGGIGGRPIAITECLTDQTPEKGKACMDAAATAKPTAVLAVQPGTAARLARVPRAGRRPVRRADVQHQRHTLGSVLHVLLRFRLRRLVLVVGELPQDHPHREARRAGVHQRARSIEWREGVRGSDLPARRDHTGGDSDPGSHHRRDHRAHTCVPDRARRARRPLDGTGLHLHHEGARRRSAPRSRSCSLRCAPMPTC